MKSLLSLTFVVALFAPAAGAQSSSTIDQNIMIVIVTSAANNTANGGSSMMRLSFPSADACAAAAKIMEQDIRGGFVTARCLKTH